MSAEAVVGTAREMMALALLLVSPFLFGAVLASLAIGLLQASTRMNDLTLSFVPRFFAVLLVLYLAASWAGGRLVASVERAGIAIESVRE